MLPLFYGRKTLIGTMSKHTPMEDALSAERALGQFMAVLSGSKYRSQLLRQALGFSKELANVTVSAGT